MKLDDLLRIYRVAVCFDIYSLSRSFLPNVAFVPLRFMFGSVCRWLSAYVLTKTLGSEVPCGSFLKRIKFSRQFPVGFIMAELFCLLYCSYVTSGLLGGWRDVLVESLAALAEDQSLGLNTHMVASNYP